MTEHEKIKQSVDNIKEFCEKHGWHQTIKETLFKFLDMVENNSEILNKDK